MLDGKKVKATGGWTFVVEPQFEVLDNGDSVQAVDGDRIVYVSSLRLGRPEALIPAAQLRWTVARPPFFGLGERFAHVGQSVQGDAEVVLEGDSWCLRGTMCAEGTVATCTIDFRKRDEQSWAVSVWKSLTYSKGAD